MRAAGAQAARGEVHTVVDLLDGSQYAHACLLRDAGLAVNHGRHRLLGDVA